LDKIRKAFSLIKTPAGRKKLKKAINDEIFKASFPLIGICGGRNFWKPRIIGIEPTNQCNLNCIMCPRRYWDEERNLLGDMSMGLFKDKILPFLNPSQTVHLYCLGEPLLGQHFFEMLSECKNKGCTVHFNTNGLLLKKYARKLVELGTDSITVSIDGIKSFKNIRGVEIDLIIDGIQELNLIKRQLNREYPIIHIEFVAMRQNISELPELVDVAYKLGIKAIGVVHAIIHSRQLIDQSLFMHIELANKYFNEAFLKAQKLGIRINLPPLKETVKFCHQPFEIIFINWNGDVRPCCGSTMNEEICIKLGNLEDFSLPEFWNSFQMRKLRIALLRGKHLPELCRKCPMRIYSLESHTWILKNG